ncbi:non-specific serine/threonine protein kinase [Malassezia cuniculi]|uniref:non-specific serine/threonine protein kinase n=1 Tax=Malassezia cuniculi TaxID=948313 RepID=A0AAF0J4X9_9BASI|nr:non-specific serine/threonine protein kinase [Malassezia cuniculi]
MSDASDVIDTPDDPAQSAGIFELESDTPGISDSDIDETCTRAANPAALAQRLRSVRRRGSGTRHINSPSLSSPLAFSRALPDEAKRPPQRRLTNSLRPASHSGSLSSSMPRISRAAAPRRVTPPGSMGPPAVPMRITSPTRDRSQPLHVPLHRRAHSTGFLDPVCSSPVGGPDGVDPGLVAAIGSDVSMSPRVRDHDPSLRLWSAIDSHPASPLPHTHTSSGSWSAHWSSPLAQARRSASLDQPTLLSPANTVELSESIRLQPVPSCVKRASMLQVNQRAPSRGAQPTSPLPSPVSSPQSGPPPLPLGSTRPRQPPKRRHSVDSLPLPPKRNQASIAARILSDRRTAPLKWTDWTSDERAPQPRPSWNAVRRASPCTVPWPIRDECRRRSTPTLTLHCRSSHTASPPRARDDIFSRAPRIVSAPVPPHLRPITPKRHHTTGEGLSQREQCWQQVAHAKTLCDTELERIIAKLVALEDVGDVTTVARDDTPSEHDDAHLGPTQRMAIIAMLVHGLDASYLAEHPHACHGYISELQDLATVWETHPDWPGRAWNVEILLCIAGLSRVLEWWDEERRFWNIEESTPRKHEEEQMSATRVPTPSEPQNVLMELSLECKVQYLSASWLNVTGKDPTALCGAPIRILLSPQCAGIFSRAVRQLSEQSSYTVEVMFEVVHADGSYIPMSGQGMLVHGQGGRVASHTMWVLRPLETGTDGFVPDDLQVSTRYAGVLSYDAPLSTELLLCRICERDIPAWFFEKHSEICNEIHRLEMETGTCNEALLDMCHTIGQITSSIDSGKPQSYRGFPIHVISSARPSALEAASRAVTAEHMTKGTTRKQCIRAMEEILDVIQVALSIPTPAIPEGANEVPANLDLLPPDALAQLDVLRSWVPPHSHEAALELMANDAAAAVRAKLHVVNRMRNTIVYVETVRIECEQWVAQTLNKPEVPVIVNDVDDLADDVSGILLEPQEEKEVPDLVSDYEEEEEPQHGSTRPIVIPGSHGVHTPPRSPRGASVSSNSSRQLPLPQSPRSNTPMSPHVIPSAQPRATVTSIKDFVVIKPISKGAYGSVFLARKRATGDYYAIKVLKKSDMIAKNQITNVRAERTILMNRAQSPFVVRLFFTFQSAEYLYLVMEYLPGGDCASLVRVFGGLPEDWARQYLAEMVQCLEYLHSTGVVHRDMKPDNWLIDNRGHLKLTDFGLSKFGLLGRQTHAPYASHVDVPSSKWAQSGASGDVPLADIESPILDARVNPNEAFTSSMALGSEARLKRAVGTPDYLAPESVLGVGMDGFGVDWWAVGVMLFEFIYGYPPFHADTPARVFDNIVSRNMDWDARVPISPEAKDLINRLVCTEVQQRLGANGVGEIKSHPFFAGVDWEHLTDADGPFVPRVFDAESTDYFDPRGAVPLSFDDDEDAVSASSASPHIGATPSHSRSRSRVSMSLSNVSMTPNEFGSFSYKNLPVLKQANDEMVRRIRSEHAGWVSSPASDEALRVPSHSSPAISATESPCGSPAVLSSSPVPQYRIGSSVLCDDPEPMRSGSEPVRSPSVPLYHPSQSAMSNDYAAQLPSVLVADENTVSRSMLDAAFAACGVAVDTAADGADTVRMALGDKQYSAIILTLSLHIVNSQDVARMIKSTRNLNSNTPLVALIDHGSDDDDIDVSGSVFDTCLALPPSIARVRALLGWLHSAQRNNRNTIMHERAPLLGGGGRSVQQLGPILRLLVVPFVLGLLQTVATAAEVDALRSLACTEYYDVHSPLLGSGPDKASCRLPEVEAHFSALMLRVTITVTLANLLGMLVYGRLFRLGARRWMAVLGMTGNLVARIPMVVLPLAQYPYLLPNSLRSWDPHTMVYIYWGCLVFCGFSGASELVVLCIDSYIVDASSPHVRSKLFARIQIAQLLGASMGPTLGHFAVSLLPSLTNRRLGYVQPIGDTFAPYLFNTASYWLAIAIAAFGILWMAVGVRELPSSESTKCTCEPQMQVAPDWLGQYRLLVPQHIFGWEYDFRVAKFTLAEALNGLSVEGIVVLVYVLGYVFHWGQAELSLALTVSNSLNLAMTVFGFPVMVKAMMRNQHRPELMQEMSDEVIHSTLEACECETDLSASQRATVRLWRAKADLNAARFSLACNTLSWLTLALGVWLLSPAVVIVGACALSLGICAAPMIRSAACTVADIISNNQKTLPVPPGVQGVDPHRGADSYLVIVSTLLLPVLLVGPVIRNWIYSATISTFPGAFFIVIAALQASALMLLAHM